MKAHSEQHLDDLAKKVMTSAPLETPSFNFTADVMAKLDAPQVSAITTYKPLISKKAWIVIGIIMIALGYYIFSLDSSGASTTNRFDLSGIKESNVVLTLSSLFKSKVLIYSVTFFGVAWLVQVSVMKQQLNKYLNF